MNELINFDDVNNKIITIRNEMAILDSDVAMLYGVQTMHVNQAVKNNPDKFPNGYVFELSRQEWHSLRASIIANNCKSEKSERLIKNFDKSSTNDCKSKSLKSNFLPKVFTEKGLYMLATILKSPQATQTTIAIVEAFAKLRQLANNIATLNSVEPEFIEPEIIESTGGLLNELLFTGFPTSAETSFELNLGLIKAKRSIKSEKPNVPQYSQNRIDELERTIAKMNERLKKLE